jgi:hypothetical protein
VVREYFSGGLVPQHVAAQQFSEQHLHSLPQQRQLKKNRQPHSARSIKNTPMPSPATNSVDLDVQWQ